MANAAKHASETSGAEADQPLGDAHIPHRLRNLLGARVDAEVYLSTDEGAKYVDRPSRQAFIKWCRRQQPPIPLRRPKGSRALVVRKGDLDWALRVR